MHRYHCRTSQRGVPVAIFEVVTLVASEEKMFSLGAATGIIDSHFQPYG